MRRLPLLWLFMLAVIGAGYATPVVCWTAGGETRLAVIEGETLHLARWRADGVIPLGSQPALGITMLAAGYWRGAAVLLGARGREILRRGNDGRWRRIGRAPVAIRQLLPARDGQSGAVLLTRDAVWWAVWKRGFTCRRVRAVKPEYHPWQLNWADVPGEARLAVATRTATPFAPFPHNCLFVFTWHGGKAAPCWLGSRLTRPYTEVTTMPRADGVTRFVALETTRDGGRGVSVYHPIQFGYTNAWRTEAVPGLLHLALGVDTVLCWGRTEDGHPRAWRLLPDGAEYRLAEITPTLPHPEALTEIHGQLVGWWDGEWHHWKESALSGDAPG